MKLSPPATLAGVDRSLAVPSPSWPSELSPAVAVTIGRHPAGVHVPGAHGNECQKGQRRRGGRRGGLSRNLFTITADDACGEGRREDDEEATHATVLPARLRAGSYSSGDPL